MRPVLVNLPAKREPIRIFIDAPNRCEAGTCVQESKAVVFFMQDGWNRLENRLVCMAHAEHCQRIGGCLVFHLSMAPPLEHVLEAVNREIQRRRQAQAQQQYVTPFMYGGTGTMGGNMFSQGGFTIRFG